MLQDKVSIMQVLGSLMKQPSLLTQTDKYNLQNHDFPERFHMIVFAAINNVYRQGTVEITPVIIDGFLSKYDVQYKIFNDNDGLDYLYSIEQLANLSNFDYYYTRVKKYSLLRHYQNEGIDITEIYDETIINPKEQEEMQERFDGYTVDDIIKEIDKKMINIKSLFQSDSTSEGKKAGDGLEELMEDLKINPVMGVPLCSGLLNTVFRGARLKKFYIRSAPSGYGKSRTLIADACNLAVEEIYDLDKDKWVDNGNTEKVLFITTELDFEEISTPAIAFVSGVSEDKILDNKMTPTEEERVKKAIQLIKDSYLWFEYLPDFGIEDVERVIEKNILENETQYVFFDYIHSSMRLLSEITGKSKVTMREDQVLLMLSDKLKYICNKYNVFLFSATQLNSEWKNAANQDASAIRGSKAIIDKCDAAMNVLPATKEDIEKLQPILSTQFIKEPNMVINVFKNRRGKWKDIKLWVHIDLGNLRTTDLFATTKDYQIIPMKLTKIVTKKVNQEKNNIPDF